MLSTVAVVGSACSMSLLLPSFDLGGDEPQAFATAVAGGETRRAYDLLCPATRFGIPYEGFRAAVEANPFLASVTGVTIDTYRSLGGSAVVKKGWIESATGTADAEFHLSKQGAGWCVTGVVIGGTPALPIPGTATAAAVEPAGPSATAGPDADAGPGATGGRGATAEREALPAMLRNEAYRAYGLSNPATRRYVMRSEGNPKGASEVVGTQRAELISRGEGAARFRILRAGGLGMLGSLEVELRADGIHLVESSQGTLAAPALVLPAKLEPGATWETHYAVRGPGGATTDYRGSDRVEGLERVQVPAGGFDALCIASDATVTAGAQSARVRTRAWYADGVGSVRVESDTAIEGGETSRVVVELLAP